MKLKLIRWAARWMPSEMTLAAVVLAVMLLAAWRARAGMMTAPTFGFPPPGRLIVSPIYSVAVPVANGFLPRMACMSVTTNGVVMGTGNFVATSSVPVMVMDDWEVGWQCAPATRYVLTVSFNRPLPATTRVLTVVEFAARP